MKIFVMSDIHGNVEAFNNNITFINLEDENNKLILLGDYLNGHCYEDVKVIKIIMELQNKYKERVIALMGNHELYLLDDYNERKINIDHDIIQWIKTLPYYYETDNQIFVHAGIDEEAGKYWKYGVENETYCNKYPYTTGVFYKDIIAGHLSAFEISKKENNVIEQGDLYYDGKNHFYIDGDTKQTNKIPVLIYSEENNNYEKIFNNQRVNLIKGEKYDGL